MPIRCLHCGAYLAQAPADHVPAELRDLLGMLSKRATIRAAILRVLTKRFGEEVPTELIYEEAYPGPDGGPETIENTLRVHASHLRRDLRPFGLTVINGRHPSSYRLDFIQKAEAAP